MLTAPRHTPFSLSSNALKLIAIGAMTIDHIAWAFVPAETALGITMHLIGRITGPVMFYSAVEGYHHTQNLNRYLGRLTLFALLSWFPFVYCFSGGTIPSLTDFRPNVIYTILIGVLAIHARRHIKNILLNGMLLLFLAALTVSADWGLLGFAIIVVFDRFYGNFKHQACGYLAIVLFVFVVPVITRYDQIGPPTNLLSFVQSFSPWQLSQLGMFLPILLLSRYHGKKGKGGKTMQWFFYAYYPLHLLILGGLQSILP